METDLVTMRLDRYDGLINNIKYLEDKIKEERQAMMEELKKVFSLSGIDGYSSVQLVINYEDVVRELYGDSFVSPEGVTYVLAKDGNAIIKEYGVYKREEKEETEE